MRLIILIAALVFPISAFAQNSLPRAGEAMGTADVETETERVTEYNMESEDVEGGHDKPFGDTVRGEKRQKTSSLIKTRSDFIPELLESVEDI